MAISACWIAKNEAAVIARSIQSIKDAVDDLVVVDTGSTDDTIQVARALGARVFSFEWIDDFAAARNFAMAQTKNELVMFLDADEWFEPSVTAQDGRDMEQVFIKTPQYDVAQYKMTHLDGEGGVIMATEQVRLLRKRPNNMYLNPIHEYFGTRDSKDLYEVKFTQWEIKHTGYVASIRKEKVTRNIEMLKAHTERTDDISQTINSYVYLVREHLFSGQTEEAFPYLRKVLDHSEYIARRVIYRHFVVMIDYLLQGANALQSKFSRREVKDKLFDQMSHGYNEYPGTITSELYYEANFDLKEDRLLSRADDVLRRVHEMKQFEPPLYNLAEAQIHASYALALDRRGDMLGTFDHAVASIKANKRFSPAMITTLLKCTRGQSPQDVAQLLNQLFDVTSAEQLGFLAQSTRIEGFLDLYAYYQVKRSKLIEGVNRIDQIELLFTQRRYAEALDAVLKTATEEPGVYNEQVASYLMALGVCMNDPGIHQRYGEVMPDGCQMMDNYFASVQVTERTVVENHLFPLVYKLVALVEGADLADRFARVFWNFPVLRFTVRAPYCLGVWRYQEVADDPMTGIAPDDFNCYSYVIHANICLERYAEAYRHIRRFLVDYAVDDADLLTNLLVVAEKAEGSLAADAHALYDRHMRYHDALIELRDIVKSGYVVDELNKSRTRKLRAMNMDAFRQQLAEEDDGSLVTDELLKAYEEAATVYEEKGMPGMALQCYRKVYAHAPHRQDVRESLARVFAALGNREMASALTATKEARILFIQ